MNVCACVGLAVGVKSWDQKVSSSSPLWHNLKIRLIKKNEWYRGCHQQIKLKASTNDKDRITEIFN